MKRVGSDVKIDEIARLAGVSKGTVSKVINDYPGINAETRKRVARIIRDKGFEPNSAARSLAMRRSGTIGLVIPHSPEHSLAGAYWSSLVTATATEATRLGYSLSLMLPRVEGRLHDLFASIIGARSVDGLFIGAELIDHRHISMLERTRTPFMLLGQITGTPHNCVDVDNFGAGRAIAAYLLEHGYGRPLFIGGPERLHAMRERARGFCSALADAGLKPLKPLSVPYDDTEAMRRAVRQCARTQKPDSVVTGAGGDFMFDAFASFDELGMRPPRFGFATFDDYRFLDFHTPPITAVGQPIADMGREAIRTLVEIMKQPAASPAQDRCVIMPMRIVSRESCGEKTARRKPPRG